ncbi:MAG: DUF92 domain-containing protein [Bacteroidia bacterium]
MGDIEAIVPAALLTGLLAFAFELSWRKKIFPQWLARKFLHMTAVGACAIIPLYLESLNILIYLVAGFELILIYLVGSGRLFAESKGRKSWGIALFPLPYLALLFFFDNQREFIFIPMMILAISDALACIAGTTTAKKYYNLTGDKKSIIGSFTFFLSSFVLLLLFWNSPLESTEFIIACIAIALILSSLEALGSNGSDNLLIPTGAALLLYIEMQMPFQSNEYLLLISLVIVFMLVMVKMKWLEMSGALSAALLGFFVWRFAGWEFLAPLIWFLFSSSVIGKVLKVGKDISFEKKHGKARDWIQVLSNSWLFLILAIVFGIASEDFALSLIPKLYAVMAIATADTWASEIGGRFSKKVIYLFNLKSHPKGISGGLSITGTFAGLLGGISIALIGYLTGHLPDLGILTAVALFGFAGMLVDSLLASFLQKRYFNSAQGIYSDELKSGFIETEKYRVLTNDQVNMISISLALFI